MSTFATFFFVMVAILVLFDPALRTALGEVTGLLFMPLVGFDYRYPVITLVIMGMIMTGLTTVLRHFFTDYVEQAENQKIVSAFNQEMRKARLENNTFKLKKLMEQQPQILQRSMKASATQLKLMPITLLVIIPIFAWLAVFMSQVHSPIISVPWSFNVDLNSADYLFPNWILLYSVISIPFGQILARSLRFVEFRRRLKEIAAEGKS